MVKTIIMYAVKNRDGRYMNHYENNRATWTTAPNAAWMTWDLEWAKGWASLVKTAYVVEWTVVERKVK